MRPASRLLGPLLFLLVASTAVPAATGVSGDVAILGPAPITYTVHVPDVWYSTSVPIVVVPSSSTTNSEQVRVCSGTTKLATSPPSLNFPATGAVAQTIVATMAVPGTNSWKVQVGPGPDCTGSNMVSGYTFVDTQMATFSTSITSLQAAINSLGETGKPLPTAIAALQTATTSVQTSLTATNAALAALNAKATNDNETLMDLSAAIAKQQATLATLLKLQNTTATLVRQQATASRDGDIAKQVDDMADKVDGLADQVKDLADDQGSTRTSAVAARSSGVTLTYLVAVLSLLVAGGLAWLALDMRRRHQELLVLVLASAARVGLTPDSPEMRRAMQLAGVDK